jgi:hypothetical protein
VAVPIVTEHREAMLQRARRDLYVIGGYLSFFDPTEPVIARSSSPRERVVAE